MSATRGSRGGAKGRGTPKRALKTVEIVDEEEEVAVPTKKNKATPAKGAAKGGRGRGKKEEEVVVEDEEEIDEEDDEELDEEEEDEDLAEEEEDEESDEDDSDQPAKPYGPRSYVISKSDFAKGGDPPLWRIDGNSLLQKYTPFKESDGTTLYKSTSVYSGWSANNKELYHVAPVVFKRTEKNETIVKVDLSELKAENDKEESKGGK